MRNIKMQISFLFGFASLLFASLSFSVFSATPPTPPGYATGGLFSVYFQNMVTSGDSNPSGVCPTGYGIVGFSTGSSNYGRPICTDRIGLWLKNGTSLYYTAGNIGIGTTTPGEKLQVGGNIKLSGNNRIYNGDSNFHIHSAANGSLYLNYFTGNGVYFGNGASGVNGAWLSNGRVGIGTSSPSAKLDVVGTGNFWGIRIASGASNGLVLTSDASGNARWATSSLTESDPQVGANTTNYLSKWNGTALITSQLFDNGTNVGVGTGTPSSKLEVVGSARLSAPAGGNVALGIYTNGQSNNNLTFGQGFASATDNVGYLYNTANADFVLGTNNTDRVWIKAGGNVGIGTSAPGAPLEVNGHISVANADPYVRTNTTNKWLVLAGGNGWFGGANIVLRGSTAASNPYGMEFFSSGAERMRIASSGNVGIGTSSPVNALQVKSTGTGPGAANGGLAIQGTIDGTNPSYGYSDLVFQDNSARTVSKISSFYNTSLGGGLAFTTNDNYGGNGTERMRILSNGNIGIGTTSPLQRLDVGGGIRGTGQYYINNTNPTLYLQDSDQRSAMIHNNGNVLYFLRGDGNNSTNWAPYNGMWPLTLNLENNNADFGGSIQALANVNQNINAGNAGRDYLPASSNWNYTMLLNALDTSSIGFHNAGHSVASIRYGNNGFSIGADDGWGVKSVSTPGGIKDLPTPINGSDAATKAYVDALLSGGSAGGGAEIDTWMRDHVLQGGASWSRVNDILQLTPTSYVLLVQAGTSEGFTVADSMILIDKTGVVGSVGLPTAGCYGGNVNCSNGLKLFRFPDGAHFGLVHSQKPCSINAGGGLTCSNNYYIRKYNYGLGLVASSPLIAQNSGWSGDPVDVFKDVFPDSSGRVYSIVYYKPSGGPNTMKVKRYTSSLALDTTFGTSGEMAYPLFTDTYGEVKAYSGTLAAVKITQFSSGGQQWSRYELRNLSDFSLVNTVPVVPGVRLVGYANDRFIGAGGQLYNSSLTYVGGLPMPYGAFSVPTYGPGKILDLGGGSIAGLAGGRLTFYNGTSIVGSSRILGVPFQKLGISGISNIGSTVYGWSTRTEPTGGVNQEVWTKDYTQ